MTNMAFDAATAAKRNLDALIRKARTDLYKPIQVAEVLRRARLIGDLDVLDVETYRNPSVRWRDDITKQLTGKASTSSARYQHDVWNASAMPPASLAVLHAENLRTQGGVERYIFLRYSERQATISSIIALLEKTSPDTFSLPILLTEFKTQAGIKRSIDKAYEIVTYGLFETIVTALGATVEVSIPATGRALLAEFSDLASVLLGLSPGLESWKVPAHIYRVGVTNAADRGLDMWANFGPAIQVKHLTLDEKRATAIVGQIESDHIVIVCRDADATAIRAIAKQISWGQRVRGIVRESELVSWYDRCLHGKFASTLAMPLLERLRTSFKAEFPQALTLLEFMKERGYLSMPVDDFWATKVDILSEAMTST